MKIFAFIFLLGLCSLKNVYATGYDYSFNVLDFGAVGDGVTDDSQALLRAWNYACILETGISLVVIPENRTFLSSPVLFQGPCKADTIDFEIAGTIVAPTSPTLWNETDASQWLGFSHVTGLYVYGSGKGTVDGQGQGWWDQSCRYHPHLEGCTKLAPTAMKFLSCKDCSLRDMYFTNSSQTHVLIKDCEGMQIENVMIRAPGKSPNTDGIHISSSRHVTITNTNIGTGDDCISIGDSTSNVRIINVQCGPGHGVSIGSLGKSGNFVKVNDIYVSNVVFKGTTNGARIKTWQKGRGYVRNVIFERLRFNSVKNPIIIDQNYCDVRGACKQLPTGVHISNVIYRELFGTSSSEVAINLECSQSVPCTGIMMESINLRSAIDGEQVISNCTNAKGLQHGVVPGSCLQDTENIS